MLKSLNESKAFSNFKNGIIFNVTNLKEALITEQIGACAVMLIPKLDSSIILDIKCKLTIPIIYQSINEYEMYYQHNTYSCSSFPFWLPSYY